MGFADAVLQTGQSFVWLSILFSLWIKSIVMLATAALLASILRPASARLRHMLWCAALSSLLVLPLFSGGLQPLRAPILPSSLFPTELAPRETSRATAVELPSRTAATFSSDSGSQLGQSGQSNQSLVDEQHLLSNFSLQTIILLVWLIGVLLVLGRFLVGIVAVRSIVSRSNEPVGTSWSELVSELSQQLRLKRPVRLLLSDESIMPMTCGGLSAVVVLPNEADHWPADRRRVVVLHELIHIKRRDLLTQTLAQFVCALYWFNPLAWLAIRKMRTEQEWACDEHVVATGIRRSDYAAHLLEIARKFHADALSAATTTAMARRSHLQERLCAILRPADDHFRSGRMSAVSVIIMSVVFISTAVTQFVIAEGQSGIDISNVKADPTQEPEQKEEVKRLTEEDTVVTGPLVPDDDHEPSQTPTPLDHPVDRTPDSPVDPPAASLSPGDDQTDEQVFNNFSPEERDRLVNNGIALSYIKEMANAGYRRLTVAQLIQLFSNAVRADYVAGLRSVGYAGLSTNELLALKTNGITPDLIRSFQGVKHADFRAGNYVALRSNGVTPSYLRSLSDAGYDSLTANQIVEMYVAGVTPEFIRDARSRAGTDVSPEELIELKRREKR